MTISSEPYKLNQWQTSDYVDSWLADQPAQSGYQPAREKLVSLLPFEPGDIIRVLDIGTGDGALSLELLGVYPKAELVCHDFSETMLERARQRLASLSAAVRFVKGDLRDMAWTQAIEGQFDAVISSIAIHNVAEGSQGAPERIREIYNEVFGLVKPGGCFLNYDLITAPGPAVERIYYRERFINEQTRLKAIMGIEKSLQELEQEFQERRRGRSTRSSQPGARALMNQLEWLKQAGFDEVDCLWKETRSVIFGGFKH
ncbi:MAG: class I SAM-dependent methyltransferase [Chloroflexi bacterium]|nr:class I SAM-dependent methyltransferase [Chloroflexota bacterium]